MSAAAAFRAQAQACAALGSPFMARFMALCAARLGRDTEVGRRIHDWPGVAGTGGGALPLRLAGALHALALEGRDPALGAVWGVADDDAALWAAVHDALTAHEAVILEWLARAPQTNEVARAAVLIALARWLGRPLVLSELGASAGLNLLWDRYALEVGGRRFGPEDAVLTLQPDWHGPLPRDAAPPIRARAGVDLAPADPARDRLRLIAYVWADQPERMARLDAACTEAARLRPRVDRGDAIAWLEERLDARHPGALHLVYHTVAWQYLAPEARARGDALLAAAGARADDAAPLARFAMENDGGTGAALTLTRWPGGAVTPMGRADFHGRWVCWAPGA